LGLLLSLSAIIRGDELPLPATMTGITFHCLLKFHLPIKISVVVCPHDGIRYDAFSVVRRQEHRLSSETAPLWYCSVMHRIAERQKRKKKTSTMFIFQLRRLHACTMLASTVCLQNRACVVCIYCAFSVCVM